MGESEKGKLDIHFSKIRELMDNKILSYSVSKDSNLPPTW